MDCKSCKWLKIYDYTFEDGTKTIACENIKNILALPIKRDKLKELKQ